MVDDVIIYRELRLLWFELSASVEHDNLGQYARFGPRLRGS